MNQLDELFRNAEGARKDEGGYPGIWNPDYGMIHPAPNPQQMNRYGWAAIPDPEGPRKDEKETDTTVKNAVDGVETLIDALKDSRKMNRDLISLCKTDQMERMKLYDIIQSQQETIQSQQRTIAELSRGSVDAVNEFRSFTKDLAYDNKELNDKLDNITNQYSNMSPVDHLAEAARKGISGLINKAVGYVKGWFK